MGGAAGGTEDGDSWVPGKASGCGGLQWGVRGLGALGDLGAEAYRGAGSMGSQGLGSSLPMWSFEDLSNDVAPGS